ncbi:hypothetical protein AVEN_63193-1 [Araneus ventricosus]|uniref:Uncharacterized protein n=1 Tax=Araneus ventricosus TaxID=182803 RepID=A0A4Y2B318_ARAVE|nr:hypothetical protein AVEN_63193-1 [Araneus ventricosus]
MAAAEKASNTETGVLVANRLATSRPSRRRCVLLLVEGLKSPPLLYPQEKRVPAYLYCSNSYPCTRGAPLPGVHTEISSHFVERLRLLARNVV